MTLSLLAAFASCTPEAGLDPSAVERAQSKLGVTPGSWTQLGPSPMLAPGRNIVPPGGGVTTVVDATGAVHKIVADPANADILYAGTVNGGVWKTTNATAARPTWVPQMDTQPSLSIEALAMDPTNSQQLVAGSGGAVGSFWGLSSYYGQNAPVGWVYVTTNGGGIWTPRNDLVGRAITGMAVRGGTILASTITAGAFPNISGNVFLSTAGGPFASQLSTGPLYDLAADPSDGTRYFAAGTGGVFMGTMGGTVWNSITLGADAASTAVRNALASTNNVRLGMGTDGRLYVAVSTVSEVDFVATTANQGTNWTVMDGPRFPAPPAASGNDTITDASNASPIEITTSAPHTLNATALKNQVYRVRITGVQGNTAANGDWVAGPANPPAANKFALLSPISGANSTGNGACTPAPTCAGKWQTWNNVSPGGQAYVHISIAVDPANSNNVFVGGDSGISAFGFPAGSVVRGNLAVPGTGAIPSPQWNAIVGNGTTNNTYPHADTRAMTFAGGNLLLAGDGGVFRRATPNAGGDWMSANGSLANAETHSGAFDPVSRIALGGAQDNGPMEERATGTVDWKVVTNGDGGDVAVDSKTRAANNQTIRYTATQYLGNFQWRSFDAANNPVATPDNNGNPVTQHDIALIIAGSVPPQTLGQIDITPQFVTQVALNHVTPTRMVIGANLAVFESSNRGETVTSLTLGGAANDMDYGHPNNAEALWAATGNGVFTRFTAGGMLAATTPAFPGGAGNDVVMSPGSERTAYVVGPSTVYRDVIDAMGNSTWTDLSGDLQQLSPGTLQSILYIPSAAGDRLVVAGTQGVLIGSVGVVPIRWSRLGTNLPNAYVRDLTYEASLDQVTVATMGRGVWSFPNVSSADQPTQAICKDAPKAADATCHATATAADVNNGSFSPEGEAVTLSLAPAGPYNLGPTAVTLTVQDTSGETATCNATVNVFDATPPSITAPPAKTSSVCSLNTGLPMVSDNCSTPTVTGQAVSRNGVPLSPPIPIGANGDVTLPFGTYIVQWTATDGINTSLPVIQTVTSQDPEAQYIQQLANGNMRYSVTFPPPQQAYVEAFVRQNGIQNVAGNIVSSKVANPDGTFTYSKTVAASQYHVGDVINVRFYSYRSGQPGVFTPGGPTDSVWFPDFIYGSGTACADACRSTFKQRTNGDVTVSLTVPSKQSYAEAFVRDKTTQVASGNVAPTAIANFDGTFTYSRTVPASNFHSGDSVTWRWYYYVTGGPQVFAPGPTATTWFPGFKYSVPPTSDCP